MTVKTRRLLTRFEALYRECFYVHFLLLERQGQGGQTDSNRDGVATKPKR